MHGKQDDVASSASPAIPVVTTDADRERGRVPRAIVFWGQTSRTLTQASATFRETLGGSHDKASRLNGYGGQPVRLCRKHVRFWFPLRTPGLNHLFARVYEKFSEWPE